MNDLTFQIAKAWFYPTCPACCTFSPLGSLSLPPSSSQIHFLMVFHTKSIIALMLLFMVVPTLRIYSTCVFLFFAFLKSACIYWVLYARHYSRLLEYIHAQNSENLCLHGTDLLEQMLFLVSLHHLVADLIPGGPAQIPVQIRGPHMEIAFSKLSLYLSSIQYI